MSESWNSKIIAQLEQQIETIASGDLTLEKTAVIRELLVIRHQLLEPAKGLGSLCGAGGYAVGAFTGGKVAYGTKSFFGIGAVEASNSSNNPNPLGLYFDAKNKERCLKANQEFDKRCEEFQNFLCRWFAEYHDIRATDTAVVDKIIFYDLQNLVIAARLLADNSLDKLVTKVDRKAN